MDLTMSCSSMSLLFIFSLHIHFPVPTSSKFLPFQECAPFVCGDKKISYPFRHNERPSYCGYPGYELDCDGGNLTHLSMESLEYQVIHMDWSEQILKVARMDLLKDICLGTHVNTTLNYSLFNYSSNYQNSTLFYDCNSPSTPQPDRFSCPASGDGYFAFKVDPASKLHELCNFSVSVPFIPILEGSKSTNISRATVRDILKNGFEITWIANTSLCENCTKSGGRCGYDWPRQEFNCFCPNGASTTICHKSPIPASVPPPAPTIVPSVPRNKKIGLKVGIGMAALGAGIVVTLILMQALKKQRSKYLDGEMKIKGLISSRRYTYKDIKRMTNSFKEKLGQGGYGSVYKGKLQDGQFVAVKLLKKLKGDAEEFFNEVASISKTSHVNVVTLLGFCFEGSKKALIYEFMPNGSLEKFIFNKSNTLELDQQLSWDTLYQISLGIAHGLEYLHRGCKTRILHFDIKPHNILLDTNYCPKISDFGLAKICPREESIVSLLGARGTVGYIAPELVIRNIGGVSHKSDVYSYGMMVLEMVGKRKNIEVTIDRTSEAYFPHWVHRCLELQEELGLLGITNEEDEAITKKMMIIGLWCIQIDPRARPCMSQVVEMLKGSVEALQIPPKPIFPSSSRSLAVCPCESSYLQESNDSSWNCSLSIIQDQHSL